MMAAAPSQPISIGRLPPPQAHSLLSANHPDHHQHTSNTSNSGTSPGYSYLGADLAAQNPRWAGTSASPARTTQELSTSWTIHPGPLFVSSPHHSNINSNAASSSSGVHQQNQNGAYNAGLGVSGSFTGGTPMSLSSSFYQRFLPTSSSYNNNSGSGPGVLNPLDPTEFKFSSSPYGARAGWGGGGWGGSGSYQRGFSGSYGRGGAWGVGSAESDRMSFIENYYGAKLEKEACNDFSCCGLRLKDLHALVEHFEANHANAYPELPHPMARRVSGTGKRLVNQNSSSSLAGALGEDRASSSSSAQQHQQVRGQTNDGNLSSNAAGISALRRKASARDVDGGTKVDDMEIGLDLDMDMDMDMDVDMDAHPAPPTQPPSLPHSTNGSPSTQPGSGTGSPSAISSFVPGPAMRAGYGLGGVGVGVGSSRATSPPDTPLLATPVSPAQQQQAAVNSGYNSPNQSQQQPQQQHVEGVKPGFQGFSAAGSAAWVDPNAMTPMPDSALSSASTYFGNVKQEDDTRSVGSDGSPPSTSSAATSTSNLNAWDETQQAQQQQQGHTLQHTQSLFALRAAAQAQSQEAFAAGAGGAQEAGEYVGGLGGALGTGLADRAAAQRAREREEALLRQGSGVLNGYAAYADWSRGFPGADSASAGNAAAETETRVVGPTESGVHPGLLFGNPAQGGKKEQGKRVNLRVGVPNGGGGAGKSASSPATPLNAIPPAAPAAPVASTSASGSGSPSSDPGLASPLSASANGASYDVTGGSTSTSSLLLSKPFKCPTPGCTKSYKQANGLKYHVTHGQCSFTPPPELSSLTALSALTGSSLTSPQSSSSSNASSLMGPANGRDATASTLSAATLDKLRASLSLTASSSSGAPLTLVSAEATLARLSAEERREVEREAERRLRPFCCAVPPCQRRYKNMNGLRYHYAHSGEHGREGMRLLTMGKGGAASGATSPVEKTPTTESGGGRKKVTASAPATPKGGSFGSQQQQQQQQQAVNQQQQTMGALPLPPFPFPFPFPAGVNWSNYASYVPPGGFATTSVQQQQGQAQAQKGPRMGTIQTNGPGTVLSQPASAYASPWSSRAPSPTRPQSQSQPLSQIQTQLTSPVEEPPSSAYPGDGDDAEMEEEEREDGAEDEFGYPEEVEEEMIEREAAAVAA